MVKIGAAIAISVRNVLEAVLVEEARVQDGPLTLTERIMCLPHTTIHKNAMAFSAQPCLKNLSLDNEAA